MNRSDDPNPLDSEMPCGTQGCNGTVALGMSSYDILLC
jgi:hypothetical protein